MKQLSKLVFIILFLAGQLLTAQEGSLKGLVADNDSGVPLPGVNVLVKGTQTGAATDKLGVYHIDHLDAGIYTLEFLMIGYEKLVVPNVFIKSNKTTNIDVEISEKTVELGEAITVTAGSYFKKDEDAPVSSNSISYEEIRRAPGAREDVSRMVQNLASASPSTDDRNDLIVRGGSPAEVLFMVDHIEIPNPNHFGTQGATGGPISMINNEFIKRVDFSAGGFPARYGNKMSGIVDITYRKGNPGKLSGSLDLGFAGAGANLEGTFGSGKGNWLFGAHRSYLDFMENFLKMNGVPVYSNLQGKINYNLADDMQMSFLTIAGDDRISLDYEPEKKDLIKGKPDTVDTYKEGMRTRQYSVGLNLSKVWSNGLLSSFTLSRSYNYYKIYSDAALKYVFRNPAGGKLEKHDIPGSQKDVFDNRSEESVNNFKTDWIWQINKNNELSWGAGLYLLDFNHRIFINPFDSVNVTGGIDDPQTIELNQKLTPKYAAFLSYIHRFGGKFTTNIGLRYDYFDILKTKDWSPRFNMSYRFSDRLTVSAAAGIYYQPPEFVYISGNPKNKERLKSMRSDHYILGMDYLLGEALLLSLEIYTKNYSSYPVSADPDYAFYSTANSGAEYGGFVGLDLVSEGTGRASGLEVLLHKKLIDNFYFLAAYSYSKVQHKAKDGILRNGMFDNRHTASLSAAYRLNKSLEFSAKWRYAEGMPYTPFDDEASIAAGTGQYDMSRINRAKYKPYYRLDLRFDEREYYKNFTLVSYFSIENVYMRKNQALAIWNKHKERTDFLTQTEIFIVGGIRIEF